jgi:hypothetical protein
LAHTEPLIQQGLAEAAQTLAIGHLDSGEYFFSLDTTDKVHIPPNHATTEPVIPPLNHPNTAQLPS